MTSRITPSSSINREVLRLAVPSILANITVPLVGMVDVAIAGHLSNASAIGGIAIGTMLFDLLYWNFGFLRVGTGGMTAQAYGRRDFTAAAEIFAQSITIALASALLIGLIAWPFLTGVMSLVPCSDEVAAFARRYFFIRIWAAPATLSLMAFKGWFIGMQDTVSPMICDLMVNGVNIIASFALAVWTPLGVIGVAWGTLIAQYTGLAVATMLLVVRYRRHFVGLNVRACLTHSKLRRLFVLNGDLFVRSLCFMVVYVGFTSLSAKYGDGPLAVSSIMMKLFMLFSYFIDGFAYAGEALSGRFFGEQNRRRLEKVVRILFVWTIGVGLLFTILYALWGEGMVRLMTSDTAVIEGSRPYLPWLVAMPLISCVAFMWDGIFVGATASASMRNAMIAAAAGFAIACLALQPRWGIQAIYVGYFVHLIMRTLWLTIAWPKTKFLRLPPP
jgi:MATE family multidrug resistance protein